MGGLEVRRNRYRKVTGLVVSNTGDHASRLLTAVITVNVNGYVPNHVKVRSRIDGEMFTAEFESTILERLEVDSSINSVTIYDDLDMVE